MNRVAKQLGMVRIWKDGDDWHFVPVSQWAPENAEIGRWMRDNGEDVIYIDRGASGEFIRGAVKG